MNTRYTFLKESPPIPPIAACISNLKRQVGQLYHVSNNEIEVSSNLQLIQYIVDDMKGQMESLHLREMDSMDDDLNDDREGFIQQQVMNARKWLELDMEEDSKKPQAVVAQTPESAPTSQYRSYPHINTRLDNSDSFRLSSHADNARFPTVSDAGVVWKDNLVGGDDKGLLAHIVAYDNQDQIDGFERIKPKGNPFLLSDVESYVNRLKAKQTRNETSHISNVHRDDRTPIKVSPKVGRSKGSSKKGSDKKSRRTSPVSSQKISKSKTPLKENVTVSSPLASIETYKTMNRPTTSQSARPLLMNNFVDDVSDDPPETRSFLPQPTSFSPPSTPKSFLLNDELIAPPSPVEKESLRKIRPPTRKKGPPSALDLEPPIPVVQFDGDPNPRENFAQTDFLPYSKLSETSKITQSDYQYPSGLVNTPTELLRRPLHNNNTVSPILNDTSASGGVLGSLSLPDSLLSQEPGLLTIPANIFSTHLGDSVERQGFEHKSPIVVPSAQVLRENRTDLDAPRNTTPKRRAGNAGLELALPIGTPNSRRNSEGSISTMDLILNAPFDTDNKTTNRPDSNVSKSSKSKPSRRKSTKKTRLEQFVTSSLHPDQDTHMKEFELKKSVPKKRRSVVKKPTPTPTISRPKSSHNTKESITPLSDFVHSPLKHTNTEVLQNLIGVSDRLNKGKKTRKLMELLRDVNNLRAEYQTVVEKESQS